MGNPILTRLSGSSTGISISEWHPEMTRDEISTRENINRFIGTKVKRIEITGKANQQFRNTRQKDKEICLRGKK